MELEEMKTLWGEMSVKLEQQKKITDSIILKMIQRNYMDKTNKILFWEAMGTLVSFAFVLYILLNYQKLNNWYLMGSGIITVLILIVLPVLSFNSIRSMRRVNVLANNYKDSLQQYCRGKLQFIFVQKLSFYMGALLMVVCLPVMVKILSGKDFFMQTSVWLWYPAGFFLFYVLSKWVFKKYISITKDAENILKELEH